LVLVFNTFILLGILLIL